MSFDKVAAFEKEMSAKIIIFHHTADCKHLECYKTHDDHYLIEKPSGFFRSAYLCNCYETYKAVLSHNVNSDAMSVLQTQVTDTRPIPRNVIANAYANLTFVSSNTK